MQPRLHHLHAIVGKGLTDNEIVFYAQGSAAGFTSAIILIPHSQSAIVVFTNSVSLNDCADCITQLLLETLLDVPLANRIDYVALAKESADAQVRKFPGMREKFERGREVGTEAKALEVYTGRYCNGIRDFHIDISVNAQTGNLQLKFQGLEEQRWPMEHYQHDQFLWLMSRDDAVKRARFFGIS